MDQNKRKKEKQDFPVITLIVLFFMTLVTMLIGNRYLGKDFNVVLKWWLGMLAAGMTFFPLSYASFNRMNDGGYVIAKALGVEALAWLVWFLASIKVLRFTSSSAYICMAVCAVLNYGLYFLWCKRNERIPFEGIDNKKVSRILYHELLFLLVFIIFCYIRSFRVTISNDTEKYMDFGFLASIMNSDYMPAKDMWFSGEPINYYYFGIYVSGFLGKLAGTSAGYAYNLGLMTICSIGFVQVYALVGDLLKFAVAEYDKRRIGNDHGFTGTRTAMADFCEHIGGMIGGFAVFIAGNMHYVLYRWIYPGIDIMADGYMYWFPSSTRFITDAKNANDGTLIHEFPSYSFVLGDLHPHVTDIINVLLVVAVLFGFLLSRKERMEKAREEGEYETISRSYLIKEALNPMIIIASFLIGIIRMTNTWDFPIYFVVSGGVLCFSNAIVTGFKKDGLIVTAVHAVECIVISTLVSLPFTIHFDNMAAGVSISPYHSNPYELAVLWALPISVCVGLYVIAVNRYNSEAQAFVDGRAKKGKVRKTSEVDTGYIFNTLRNTGSDKSALEKKGDVNHFFSFIFRQELSDLFILTIAACAAGLVLTCELIYVKDIYGGVHLRTNTMFKLGYQAFILFGIVMAYGITRMIMFNETKKQRRLSIVALFFLVWTFFYFGNAANNYLFNITEGEKADRTLDSYERIIKAERNEGYVGSEYTMESDERTKVLSDMINWVNDNTSSDAVIAQMTTTAYLNFATVSAYTGRQAVIGWSNHEWLWRNSGTLDYPQEVSDRVNAMHVLYTTDDENVARDIIYKYGIDYIYVGFTETIDGNVFEDNVFGDNGTRKEAYADYKYYRGKWYAPINTNHELLKSLGEVVYDAGTCRSTGYHRVWNEAARTYVADTTGDPVYDYEYEAYIVKVGDR